MTMTDHAWTNSRYAPVPKDQYVAVKTLGMPAGVYSVALWSEGLKCFVVPRYMAASLLGEHQIKFWASAHVSDVEAVWIQSNLHISAQAMRSRAYSLVNKTVGL